MKKYVTNPLFYIWAVLLILPSHLYLGLLLMRRTQIFMFEGLNKNGTYTDLGSYASDNSNLTFLFVFLSMLKVILLLAAVHFSNKAIAIKSPISELGSE